jgi:hypothetical protein
MTEDKRLHRKGRKKSRKVLVIFASEMIILLLLFASYRIYIYLQQEPDIPVLGNMPGLQNDIPDTGEDRDDSLSPAELAAKEEQERLQKEQAERQTLIDQADRLALGYDYDGAIELIKSYKGSEGDYTVYTSFTDAISRLEKEKEALLLYGGVYNSITEVNQVFFHALVADPSKAFDGDYDSKGYNMYMTTISEFEKMIQKMYDQGYVLINMSDLVKKETLEDGTTRYVQNEIYLREGKKPFIISEDDVAYYEYMNDDGFASRIIVGEDGNPTCEMILEDGTTVTGAFDIVPILDEFVRQHPDFSYKGAKGLIVLTGYEGILGYRTNDPSSPTYEADKETAKKVVEALKADGWEFGCHSWGHKDMQKESLELLERDTRRWLEEVEPLSGPTDIYVFPFGYDIETTTGTYKSAKYKFLKESGFNFFVGVYKEPWMQIKKDYVRTTRRPLDGQAMLEFPERLTDLFDPADIIDPLRPAKNW